MKVSDLEGAELDFYVAKAEGKRVVLGSKCSSQPYIGNPRECVDYNSLWEFSKWEIFDGKEIFKWGEWDHKLWEYSSCWSHGGPIIERESIGIRQSIMESNFWLASTNEQTFEQDLVFDGPTPLVAAMRAYVASKLGSEV